MVKERRWGRHAGWAYAMILPGYSIYLAFVLIPVFWVIWLSFTNYHFTGGATWIGLQNYRTLITDSVFRKAVWNTLVYSAFSILPGMAGGLLMAILVNRSVRGIGFFRTLFFLPMVLSGVAISMAWIWVYDRFFGVLNNILFVLGFAADIDWLRDTRTALPAIIIMAIWARLGYNMVVYLSGLQTIPSEVYEAAITDGANAWQQFWFITLPLLRPTTFFLLIIGLINSFQVFDQIYIMTGGGPLNATTTIVHQIYLNGFQFYRMGYAASMAVFLLVLTVAVTLFNFWRARGGVDTDIN